MPILSTKGGHKKMKYFHKIFDEQIKQELLDCSGLTILGKVVVQEEYERHKAVYHVPGTEHIAICIKPVSMEPKVLTELRRFLYHSGVYMALDKDQMSFVINDLTYFLKTTTEKIKHWNERLKNQFIVFKPYIETDEEKVMLKIQIQSIEAANELSLTKRYLEIPHTKQTQEFIEYALYHEKTIEFADYSHFYDAPKYFICGDYLYYNFPRWEKATDNSKGWMVSGIEQSIYRVELALIYNEINHDLIETPSDLTFFNLETEPDLKFKLVEFGEVVLARKTPPVTSMNPVANMSLSAMYFNPMTVKVEHMFIDEWRGLTLSENLLYDRQDLINFHISLKINPLTVVAGMSGTGKTRLAKAYAKMLGLTEENGDLLFLPISPSYLEPSDVLGYLNPTSGCFVPSETGLVDLLVRAQQNPHAMHMVIFDEMNLAQVEHWFAPFLSILEKPENDRLLHLYSGNNVCYNAELYPASVNVGANILFIGTINLDETTKELSDRLLDRINLVTLTKSSFMQFSTMDLEREKYNGVVFTNADFQSWKDISASINAFKAHELQFFDVLHKLISKYDAQKGVSYRFLNRLGLYIQNIPLNEKGEAEIHRAKAIDISIKQGLLTKIKGSKQQIGKLVGEITAPEEELTGSELLDLINNKEFVSTSGFKHTKEEIRRKALELGLYGYTN